MVFNDTSCISAKEAEPITLSCNLSGCSNSCLNRGRELEGFWRKTTRMIKPVKTFYVKQLYRSGLLSLLWRLLETMMGYVRDLLNCKWHGEGKKGDVHHCKCERASNRKWQAAVGIQIDTFFYTSASQGK